MPEFRATASRPWRNSGGLRGIGVVDKRNLGRLHYRGDGETGRAGGEKEGRGGGGREVQFCNVNPGVGPGPCITPHRNSLFHVSLPVRVFCPPATPNFYPSSSTIYP